MADYYLVETARGPARDDDVPRREQLGWDAHAAFMDGLVEDRFVVLGGPVGDLDGDRALLVVDALTEEEARRRLAADPQFASCRAPRFSFPSRRTRRLSGRREPVARACCAR